MVKIIVIGNEKGGSGKTTTAMHLIVSLLKLGFNVGTIDIDLRQKSLSRYIENRRNTKSNIGSSALLMPTHIWIEKSDNPDITQAMQIEAQAFAQSIDSICDQDFIIVDTPGNDSPLSRLAHEVADIVITPINDSFVDLDLIGIFQSQRFEQASPGIYSTMLWEQKMKKAMSKTKELQWIVVRNRLSTMDAINKRNMEAALYKLSKRFGFKIASGFSDRVIFKELFPIGLTLLDSNCSKEIKMNASVIAARQELHNFIISLDLPEVKRKL